MTFPKINPDGGDWQVVEQTPYFRRSILWLDDKQYIQKTECLVEKEILEQNQQAYKDSDGQRWGDGKVVASIPMNVLYNDRIGLKEAVQNGDEAYLRKFLNNSDNRHYRTFKGQL